MYGRVAVNMDHLPCSCSAGGSHDLSHAPSASGFPDFVFFKSLTLVLPHNHII